MTDVEIRPARTDELAAIGEITVDAYLAEGVIDNKTTGYAVDLADTAARFRDAVLLAAVSGDGTVLGSVTIVEPGTPYAEISRPGELEFRMLSVAPSARGRGVGEALTRAVIAHARSLGIGRVVMSSSEHMKTAHRLYSRLGFSRLRERDWRPLPGVELWAFAFSLDL
ncbi:GNAT family N-acetyltransferase [Lentzea tibetensis]|uniref:GNAT family N-acetyltransferase n=1 Tax=Lentzea tibetensis TaxID=2591470 RepID=A0A563EGX9_9PSEU|nr:GNAT family N-acetyltransferase [Lentzea tibetensis]TWP44280.1 GNAT family N-acetyltransferase [Lentzea tibetensis]